MAIPNISEQNILDAITVNLRYQVSFCCLYRQINML